MNDIIAWTCIVVGVAVVAIALINTRAVLSSRRWPVTVGEIIRSEVVETLDSDDGPTHAFDVAYRYRVGAEDFTGTTVRLTPIRHGLEASRKLAERYPNGASVRVIHDPQQPARAVLEHSGGRDLLVLPLTGAVFVIAGILVLTLTQ